MSSAVTTSEVPPGVADLRAFLEGTWLLTRALEDRRLGGRGALDGSAVFAAEGGGLIYRETGVLRLGGEAFEASRVYRYRFPRPHCAEVVFEDGSRFHMLDFSGGRCAAEHRCGADLYRGRFRVAGPGEWHARWQVSGPRKDQILESRYLRAG
jgi:hypothetical protein